MHEYFSGLAGKSRLPLWLFRLYRHALANQDDGDFIMPGEVETSFIRGWAGTRLAVHRLGSATGQGRPLLLFHGLFSSAAINWVKYGHAARLAQAGFDVIMPDLRAHGMSEAPPEPTAYPEDVLVTDALIVAVSYTHLDELFEQSRAIFVGDPVEPKKFTKQIAFNVIPHIDVFLDDGFTKEEWKMVAETKKILDPKICLLYTSRCV